MVEGVTISDKVGAELVDAMMIVYVSFSDEKPQ